MYEHENDDVAGGWNTVKGKIKQQWAKLTDDDLLRVEGNWDELVGHIQSKYGETKEKAWQQVEDFKRRLKAKSDNLQ